MAKSRRVGVRVAAWLLLLAATAGGCDTVPASALIRDSQVPRELDKVTMPPYVIEPPDILLVDALRVVPLPPYRIEALDVLLIQVPNALPTQPIAGQYVVETDGTVNLGPAYGSVRLLGMTLAEAKEALKKHLRDVKDPQVDLVPTQTRGLQQIRGEHLVRQDGTISLGLYGSVRVTGLTIPEAKSAIEAHLARYLLKPEVAIDVAAYNSKVFYVIFDGGGFGQQIVRLPVAGNETVLDAMSQVGGLTAVADKKRIWVARPGPAGCSEDQILPVDWCAITTRGRTETNYQVLPGDRIYVQAEPLVTVDTALARFFSPMERVFGITLLGRGTVGALAQPLFISGNNANNVNNGTGLNAFR
jgi:polysaccharide export outer membrane protein